MVTKAFEVSFSALCFSLHPVMPKASRAMEILVANKCFMVVYLVIVSVSAVLYLPKVSEDKDVAYRRIGNKWTRRMPKPK